MMSSSKLIPRFFRSPISKHTGINQVVRTGKGHAGEATKLIRQKIRKLTQKNKKDSGQNTAVCLHHAQLGMQASQVTEVLQILY